MTVSAPTWVHHSDLLLRRGIALGLRRAGYPIVGGSRHLQPRPNTAAARLLLFEARAESLPRALALADGTDLVLVGLARIVVHATFKSMKGLTITYTSTKGTYSATWIGVRHYRLSGTIAGRRLTGTIRTHQSADGKTYAAHGSGKLGGRAVRIGGGGPTTLKSATLILT